MRSLNSNFLFFIIIIFLACSCAKEDIISISKKEKFSLEEAKENFEAQATNLCLISFFKGSVSTKSEEENIFPEWKNAIYSLSRNGDGEIYMIPLNISTDIKGKINMRLGYYKTFFHRDQEVKSYLVIRKDKNGLINRFITTSIGSVESKYSKDNPHLFTGSRKHFRGFYLISDENGECKKARYYAGGKTIELFYSKDKSLGAGHSYINENSFSIGFTLISHSHSLTKGGDGGGYDTGEGQEYCYYCHQLTTYHYLTLSEGVTILVCSNCGYPPEEIGGGEFYYFCPTCGKIEQLCTCNEGGNLLDPYDDLDERCPLCGSLDCDGNCQGGNGNNGGNTNYPNNQIPPIYTYVHGDVLVNNVIYSFDPQENNGCLINAIRYIFAIMGFNYNTQDIISLFNSKLQQSNLSPENWPYLGTAFLEGNSNYLAIFLNMFFTLDYNSTTEQAAITNGEILFTYYDVDPSTLTSHCIVIVGYRGDDTYIYYDPQDGHLHIDPGELDLKPKYPIIVNSQK